VVFYILLSSEDLPDSVHNEERSWLKYVFEAIYGSEATVVGATRDQISASGLEADSLPAALNTDGSKGELVDRHCYTVHTANSFHITLRNPWGVVGENYWQFCDQGRVSHQRLGQRSLRDSHLVCVATVY